jgi:hypothetical protein
MFLVLIQTNNYDVVCLRRTVAPCHEHRAGRTPTISGARGTLLRSSAANGTLLNGSGPPDSALGASTGVCMCCCTLSVRGLARTAAPDKEQLATASRAREAAKLTESSREWNTSCRSLK